MRYLIHFYMDTKFSNRLQGDRVAGKGKIAHSMRFTAAERVRYPSYSPRILLRHKVDSGNMVPDGIMTNG
jgi:hypothetical protein